MARCELATFAFPNRNVLVACGVLSTASQTAFITLLRASMSDVLAGTDLGVANARAGVTAGIGAIFGPLVSSWVATRYGSAAPFAMSAVCTAINMALVSVSHPERAPVA